MIGRAAWAAISATLVVMFVVIGLEAESRASKNASLQETMRMRLSENVGVFDFSVIPQEFGAVVNLNNLASGGGSQSSVICNFFRGIVSANNILVKRLIIGCVDESVSWVDINKMTLTDFFYDAWSFAIILEVDPDPERIVHYDAICACQGSCGTDSLIHRMFKDNDVETGAFQDRKSLGRFSCGVSGDFGRFHKANVDQNQYQGCQGESDSAASDNPISGKPAKSISNRVDDAYDRDTRRGASFLLTIGFLLLASPLCYLVAARLTRADLRKGADPKP